MIPPRDPTPSPSPGQPAAPRAPASGQPGAPPPQVILWDVMSTLVYDPYAELPAHFGLSPEALRAAQDPAAWEAFERGHIDEASYAARFFADGRGVALEPLKARMRQAYRYLDGVPELLAELQARGHRQLVLSNYPPWYQLIEAELGLSRYVQWAFVSCHTGHRKPEPQAYTHACQTLNLPPQACLFIDDQPANVAAARASGMPGVLRTASIYELRGELAAHGLIPS